ncbi:MAG: hypothetical protein JRH17_15545 [Deltaproteobacteria bacterium]|nr:hypothetical protein [Deltaproteobacteria bacterium]
MSWRTLGAVAPTQLVDARLQLHHAAQVVASAGVTFLEPAPDDSHPNLGWVEPLGALMGHCLPGADAQVGLRVADLSLLLVNQSGAVSDEFALDGTKLDDGYAWLAEATARAGAELPSAGITRAAYEIPNHPTGRGEAFSCKSQQAFAELARWFANGHHALVELATRVPGASDVRCWPHHFDLGSLAVLATEPDGSLAKSIGLGLSPGDDSYAEPYWYVSPWPYPEPNALPSLVRGGHWHTEGYTSAILTGSELVGGSPESQSDRLHAFLDAAVDVCQRILAD